MAIRQFSGLTPFLTLSFMIVQTLIMITGFFAVWLSQDARPHYRKYACLFGLAGQPFWFYTTYVEEQWGIFALSFIYTIAWGRGVFVHWFKSEA